MNSRTVRIGIVGAGLMGREIATAIQRWPALIDHPVTPVVTAVCDINPAALEWFDRVSTVQLKTTDFAELLASPGVDVVYIAVRHDLHEQMYCAAIEAGKDLLAEKPFGIDLGAATRISECVEQHPDRFVRCSSEMPFFPGAQQAIRMVQSGSCGRVIEVETWFRHSSDFDPLKPINWKRQVEFCGRAGVMNDLGFHALHVPLRLGFNPYRVFAALEDIFPSRPNGAGEQVPCDTFENADIIGRVESDGTSFPLKVSVKRVSPGDKNDWGFRVIGLEGGVEFTTKRANEVRYFERTQVPGGATEQVWGSFDAGSQSVWPTVTGGIFETGFSDSLLQMWAAFLAERAGELGDRFGCATPAEALRAQQIYAAALNSNESVSVVSV